MSKWKTSILKFEVLNARFTRNSIFEHILMTPVQLQSGCYSPRRFFEKRDFKIPKGDANPDRGIQYSPV